EVVPCTVARVTRGKLRIRLCVEHPAVDFVTGLDILGGKPFSLKCSEHVKGILVHGVFQRGDIGDGSPCGWYFLTAGVSPNIGVMKVEKHLHSLVLCAGYCLLYVRKIVVALRAPGVVHVLSPIGTMPQAYTDERGAVIIEYAIRIPRFTFVAIRSAVVENLVDVRQVSAKMEVIHLPRRRVRSFIP